jgi:Domain of unknown function (DUF5666)
MEDYDKIFPLEQTPVLRPHRRRWFLIGGLAFAFVLALGVGMFMGASTSTTQASARTSESTSDSQSLAVSSVNGNTIVAKSANGSSVTIHTTASTRFTQARNSVAASTVKVGARIHVMGTHNSDGSITATSIDIG